MKNKIIKFILFFIPSIILISYYAKKKLINLFEFDIFDVDFNDDKEQDI